MELIGREIEVSGDRSYGEAVGFELGIVGAGEEMNVVAVLREARSIVAADGAGADDRD